MEKHKKYPDFSDVAILVGLFVGCSFAGSLIGGLALLLGGSQGLMMALAYLVSIGGTLGFAVYFRNMRTGEKGFPRFNFSFKISWLPVLAWALVLIAAVSIAIEPLVDIFPREWYEILMKNMGHGWWAVLATVVMAPIFEELLFRGVLQTPATEKYGPFRGILLSAAVFGLIHFIPQQVINAFVVGIILGYVYYKTGSLGPVIILHLINNAVALISTGEERTPQSLREMIPNDAFYYTLYGASLVLVVVGAVGMYRQLSKKETPAAQ